MKKLKTLPRPRVTQWTAEVVAERALDLYLLERRADRAYGDCIRRCEKFKELHEIDRVNHADPAFRKYTSKQWSAYQEARHEVAKAKARLTTACRNVLMPAVRVTQKMMDEFMCPKKKPVKVPVTRTTLAREADDRDSIPF